MNWQIWVLLSAFYALFCAGTSIACIVLWRDLIKGLDLEVYPPASAGEIAIAVLVGAVWPAAVALVYVAMVAFYFMDFLRTIGRRNRDRRGL